MNKKTRIAFISLIVLLVIVVVGKYTYTYLVQKPPAFLIKLVTKTKAPPPLPSGDGVPFSVPDGFEMTIFSRDVPHARVMTRDTKGTMLVTEAGDAPDGKVVALPDSNRDGKADSVVTVLSGLNQPHGISVVCTGKNNTNCLLYVAETGSLKSYTYDPDTLTASNGQEIATFPTGSGHFTRTLLPSSDHMSLLISIGSDCNVCLEDNPLRATIQKFDLATHKLSTIGSGLRNSVFMALSPLDGALWATDNGRDVLGDDIPPDEVNIIKQDGNYGWPLCYGNNVHDTDFDKRTYVSDPCMTAIPPHIALPAHVAALGIAFVPKEGWPSGWANDVLVAFHGSWNRSTPSGYKVVRIHLDENGNQVGEIQDLVTGFIPPGSKDTNDVIGRPVGLLAEPGVLYVSDDRQGMVYRVAVKGSTAR
jgi:glucose/arabinose dehydrogenase